MSPQSLDQLVAARLLERKPPDAEARLPRHMGRVGGHERGATLEQLAKAVSKFGCEADQIAFERRQ